MNWETILESVHELAELCLVKNALVTTAESCTGGMVSSAMTEISGSSRWFDRGFVTYSNEAKQDMLAVDKDLLSQDGAVSESVARAMAIGALKGSLAGFSLAVTGIAGPNSDSSEKPVGLVHFAWANKNGICLHDRQIFTGSRQDIRMKSVKHAIEGLIDLIRES